jgi:hypothetical protein
MFELPATVALRLSSPVPPIPALCGPAPSCAPGAAFVLAVVVFEFAVAFVTVVSLTPHAPKSAHAQTSTTDKIMFLRI